MRKLQLIATLALLVSANSVSAENAGGAAHAPSAKPAATNAKDQKTPVSVSGMAASDYAQCVSDLTSSHVVFQEARDLTEQGCKLSGAIRLKSVATAAGSVSMAGEPVMLCSFARTFSGWVREIAAPLALGYAGARLARIETGEAFACKARYDKPGQVPSEHAKGNAVDIAAFSLADGRRILVKQQDDETGRALVHALRMTACGYFTTVLGPGADPAHAAHFHFDSAVHGETPNYRICE